MSDELHELAALSDQSSEMQGIVCIINRRGKTFARLAGTYRERPDEALVAMAKVALTLRRSPDQRSRLGDPMTKAEIAAQRS